MKKKKYHVFGTVPKSNRKNHRKRQNTHVHEGLLSWLGTGISVKSGEVK